ncbi:formimidoylglutamase [Flexithrix dorotheae]|uniref:formimidoylglutamase n=1 Tax=Flexithrix dorotheae TaxID=70993 RepID=UPI00035DE698|nr:formimidoylglutamase [Flexithrix dorotheae]
MSLRLFFESLSKAEQKDISGKKCLFENISIHGEVFPGWENAEIAIFGVNDYQFARKENIEKNSISPLRKAFYKLREFSKEVKVVDLGNLRLGESFQDTIDRLTEVCEILISHNTLPVILGGAHGLDYGQFKSYQNLDKIITMLNVDSRINLGSEIGEENHVHQILMHHPNYLFEYIHLGYQRYLNDKSVIEILQKLNFEIKSLGQVRDNFKETEPLIRSADLLSFDISSLRQSEVLATPELFPFGLTGEEACQLCWYAGLNEKLSSIGFYGFHSSLDRDNISANVVATMVWYFIEGFSFRKKELSFKSNFYVKYIVPIDVKEVSDTHEIIFYKSKISDKWWMEINLEEKNSSDTLGRNMVLPCSYSDFEEANKGNIPNRWLKAVGKLT